MRTVITETRLDMKDVNRHDRMEDCSELSRGNLRAARRSWEMIKDDTEMWILKVRSGFIWLRIRLWSNGGPSEISAILVAKSEIHQ